MVCLVDASVFCNIVGVPGRAQRRRETLDHLKELIEQQAFLLLPLAAIVETGNHVSQVTDGRLRRHAAEAFARLVTQAIDNEAPWQLTPAVEAPALRAWLAEFPDHAMRGLGIGDLSLVKEWERQCQLHQGRRVLVWSYDGHLAGYDRPPRL